MIPSDDFTPHGYLDNPYHSWKLNPSGVLRSLPPLGMGWHVPNLGSYVNNQFQYTAHLTVGLKINDLVLITADDFLRHRCTISSSVHTKNRFAYVCWVPQYDLTLQVCYFLVQEDALGCIIELSSELDYPLSVSCSLTHLHTHNPHTSRLWEHGWYALANRERGYAILGLASEGDVFAHGAHAVNGTQIEWRDASLATSLAEIGAYANGARVSPPGVTQRDPETGWQHRALALIGTLTVGKAATPPARLHALLARGVSQDQVHRRWHDGLQHLAHAEAQHRRADERFWQQAPQLHGDWPGSWKRGLVYDLETLRMVIRPSAGVVAGPFDGMQIQAPRLVLAEAAMDALFLSYADPELAAEVMLTHFTSAPRPNLPCMREDGSYNMVADDGQVCGTAPEWGYPLWCADQLWRRSADTSWLQRLYPAAAAYLRWWLEQRCDHDGWAIYMCSWESGQDVSSRFGPQQTGGTIIEHVRPVDLQASIAQGAAILAGWAETLASLHSAEQQENPYPAESTFWHGVATAFMVKTRLLWHDGWFRDYDSVTGTWSSEHDAMHLAPLFCAAAGREQIEHLRPILAEPPRHSSQWAPLSWPPVVMTVIGATAAAGMREEAAELAYRFIDASFRSTDSREPDAYGGLPGVTREYRSALLREKWGETDYAGAGIEGYGWGALSIHLLIRYLLGLQERQADTLSLSPVFPQALRNLHTGYQLEPLPWGAYLLRLECLVQEADRYLLRLHCQKRVPEKGYDLTAEIDEYHCAWEDRWGCGRLVHLPDLTLSPDEPTEF